MKNYLAYIFYILIFTSCFGVSANITMRKDGGGRIELEYRISRMAEAIGKLDGNENWPILPVGRGDFERTIARIPGLKLISYSSRNTDTDMIIKAVLDFKDIQSLISLLGSNQASFTSANGNKLHFNLSNGIFEANADLLELLQQVSTGYEFNLGFTAPAKASLSFTDAAGKEIPPPPSVKLIQTEKKITLSITMNELLKLRQGLGLNLSW
jgi:hypothetical protein